MGETISPDCKRSLAGFSPGSVYFFSIWFKNSTRKKKKNAIRDLQHCFFFAPPQPSSRPPPAWIFIFRDGLAADENLSLHLLFVDCCLLSKGKWEQWRLLTLILSLPHAAFLAGNCHRASPPPLFFFLVSLLIGITSLTLNSGAEQIFHCESPSGAGECDGGTQFAVNRLLELRRLRVADSPGGDNSPCLSVCVGVSGGGKLCSLHIWEGWWAGGPKL